MATYSGIKQSVLEATSIARVIATNYNDIDSLPTSGNVVGEQALVLGDSSTDRLYIWEGSAWYQIALIQNSPTFTTSPDDTYELATDGVTTTVITLAATDPEGFPVTFSAVTNVGFDSIATVSQDSSVFTVTPFSKDSAGVSRSGTITFKASDGISVASAISTFTISFAVENSNFTEVHLKASGNNGNNTNINDASSHNRTITRNGDIKTQSFTPYHPGGYSTYFDGSGDYLDLDFNAIGTSDFTIEAWVYITDSSANQFICDFRPTSTDDTTGMNIQFRSNNVLYVGSYNVAYITGSTTYSDNTWVHVALVRNGSTLTLYGNGISQGSTSHSVNLTSTDMRIGANRSATSVYNGYIRDFRFVNGTAVYTSAFTPPTSKLTAVTNTELLTCHLPYLADGSSNDHAVTFAGNVALKRFGPYDYVSYDASTHGASVYNDGTGDYMTTPADTTHLTLDGDFTIDFWYYPTAAKNMGYVYGKYNYNSDGWAVWVTPNYSSGNFGYVTFYYGNYGSNESATNLRSTVVTLNQWHYIRITRSSGTMYMSVNGKVGTRSNYGVNGLSWSDTRTFNADTTINISGNSVGEILGEAYLSDFRVINGTALTTGNFTPPTSPVTAVTNTKLLTCNDAPDVFDSSGRKRVTPFGITSANQNTKYTSNIVLDGGAEYVFFYPETGSYHSAVTGDFTVETWIKLDSNTITYPYLWIVRNSSNTSGPRINARFGDSGFGYHLQFELNGTGVANVYSVSLTQSNFSYYRHVALTRSNGIVRCFVDGTQRSFGTGANPSSFPSNTISFSNSITSIDQIYIGYAVDGQMEDFRFTNGLARYTSNFTPPTAELEA